MDKLLDLLDLVGGYNCHLLIKSVTKDGITITDFGFHTRITSINYGYEDNELQIFHKQDNQKLSEINIDISGSKVATNKKTLSAAFVNNYIVTRMTFYYDADSTRMPYKNNIRLPQAKKGEHVCQVCGKIIGSSSGLTLHIKNNHPDEYETLKLTCKKCGKVCNSTSGFTLHVKKCEG
jgi:RNase P subunit RPR2